ncbi:uncharacterized protein B0I36DRAFT_316374 [Microdochium trichocladiopsis]|uniref:Uncharacterized protein n=1 Tax=Microdochium trichocladiopsis TaxID=1682393 RepID=A0A9P9BUS7_9PEZI|nr:uncharacterized protein B0I36DRAFT_343412 [Microdochium trichocladiopsis]XP_046017565.1 uncharacterized protein B0I36DRAFT_316280 [Microdochium trichocladiopsis]XP_046017593.1 uncharacterized protein B0I36DRAFT_316374 [Microdochium trichocladiopsis]KAH7007832.1 hypothetical protein B0I36DRAFT_343412 [Microdochium trichocladiopsis]KAH7038444.1 hypothetical protein B0I36DRAFT_316280 [Microdochium trichocladiopsis]KAH7038472.1 hypothetical protein B0I36DRAFT_316374 [Microdochium trichocladiops
MGLVGDSAPRGHEVKQGVYFVTLREDAEVQQWSCRLPKDAARLRWSALMAETTGQVLDGDGPRGLEHSIEEVERTFTKALWQWCEEFGLSVQGFSSPGEMEGEGLPISTFQLASLMAMRAPHRYEVSSRDVREQFFGNARRFVPRAVKSALGCECVCHSLSAGADSDPYVSLLGRFATRRQWVAASLFASAYLARYIGQWAQIQDMDVVSLCVEEWLMSLGSTAVLGWTASSFWAAADQWRNQVSCTEEKPCTCVSLAVKDCWSEDDLILAPPGLRGALGRYRLFCQRYAY